MKRAAVEGAGDGNQNKRRRVLQDVARLSSLDAINDNCVLENLEVSFS